jgi:hypothetical protein
VITQLAAIVGVLQGVASVIVLVMIIVSAFRSGPVTSEQEERSLMRALSWPTDRGDTWAGVDVRSQNELPSIFGLNAPGLQIASDS